jgi:hypothetical protein
MAKSTKGLISELFATINKSEDSSVSFGELKNIITAQDFNEKLNKKIEAEKNKPKYRNALERKKLVSKDWSRHKMQGNPDKNEFPTAMEYIKSVAQNLSSASKDSLQEWFATEFNKKKGSSKTSSESQSVSSAE